MNPYPAMNGTGWCTDPALTVMHILRDYCRCEYNKTKLYRGHIRSLPYQLMRYTNPEEVASVVKDDLIFLYKNHFDGAECTVEYLEDQQEGFGAESPRYRLAISLILADGNEKYSLGSVLVMSDKSVLEIIEVK